MHVSYSLCVYGSHISHNGAMQSNGRTGLLDWKGFVFFLVSAAVFITIHIS